MPETCSADDELNRLWNALVQSTPEPALSERDLEDAEVLRRLHAMSRMPPPPEIQARVDRGIDMSRLAAGIEPHANGHNPFRSTQADMVVFSTNGHGTNRQSPRELAAPVRALPTHPSRLAPFPLATALLLLLTLGLGIVVGSLGRFAVDRRTVLPAMAGVTVDSLPRGGDTNGSLAGAVSEAPTQTALETIFATTLAPEMLPSGGYLNFGFWRLALAPGTSTSVAPEGQLCCPGPQFTHVVAGDLTVQVDGPLRLFRGAAFDSTSVAVEPGMSTVVHPGDTIIHDAALPAAYANHGTSPVQIVTAGFSSGALSGNRWLIPMDYLDSSQEFSQSPLPAGPLAVSLLRAVLPPSGEVSAFPRGAIVLAVGADGDASIGKHADDGSLLNINDQTETIYIVTIEPLGTQR